MQSTSVINSAVEHNKARGPRQRSELDQPVLLQHRKLGFSVAIIAQNALFGECLRTGLLSSDPDLSFSVYASVQSWLSNSAPQDDDLLLICMDTREFDQISKKENESVNALRGAGLATRFLIVSSQDSPANALTALEHGASGYVPTTIHLAVLSTVLHLVHAGGSFVPASSLQQLSTRGAVSAPSSPTLDAGALSPRQLLVAKALCRGTSNKVIAYTLGMCESTVKAHVRQIMKTLNAKNRTQVAFLTNSLFPSDD